MGVTKTENFTESQNRLAHVFKALAHPARIAILEQLIEQKTCVCGDLVLQVGLAQPTISQHLKILKNAKLIKGTIEGTRICYCIDRDYWSQSYVQLREFFEADITENNCC